MEGDFDNGNVRYKARERYVFGFSDPRGIFGSNAVQLIDNLKKAALQSPFL